MLTRDLNENENSIAVAKRLLLKVTSAPIDPQSNNCSDRSMKVKLPTKRTNRPTTTDRPGHMSKQMISGLR